MIKESTLEHVAALLTNGKPDPGSQSPAQVRPNSTPPTPCSTPGQPKGFTSFVMSLPSASNDTVALLNSPLTPNERKTSRLREEVLKVEDKAQVLLIIFIQLYLIFWNINFSFSVFVQGSFCNKLLFGQVLENH